VPGKMARDGTTAVKHSTTHRQIKSSSLAATRGQWPVL
jgi:hypothetical protein